MAPVGSGKLAATSTKPWMKCLPGKGPKGETVKASMLSRCVPTHGTLAEATKLPEPKGRQRWPQPSRLWKPGCKQVFWEPVAPWPAHGGGGGGHLGLCVLDLVC